MHLLGISAWYHDSAACLIEDGLIVNARRGWRASHPVEFPPQSEHRGLRESPLSGRVHTKRLF